MPHTRKPVAQVEPRDGVRHPKRPLLIETRRTPKIASIIADLLPVEPVPRRQWERLGFYRATSRADHREKNGRQEDARKQHAG